MYKIIEQEQNFKYFYNEVLSDLLIIRYKVFFRTKCTFCIVYLFTKWKIFFYESQYMI